MYILHLAQFDIFQFNKIAFLKRRASRKVGKGYHCATQDYPERLHFLINTFAISVDIHVYIYLFGKISA